MAQRPHDPGAGGFRLWACLLLGALCVAFFGAGAWALERSVTELRHGLASSAWPSAPGRIVESKSRGGKRRSSRIRYAYTVEGRAETGTRVGYFHGMFGPRGARESARQFPVGAEVRVYYSPANAAESVLEPGLWRVGALASFVLSLAALAGGALGLRAVWQAARRG